MKKVVTNLIIATVIGMVAVTTAHGQFSTITVDELGNGLYNGTVVPAGIFSSPPVGAPGMAYVLPFNYTFPAPSADILLFEPGPTGTPPSDLLRFTANPGQPITLLFFWSDASGADLTDSAADAFTLPNPGFVYASDTEIGLFGNPYSEAGPNGFVYTAPPGAPGWDGNPAGTQYTFISEVPEPNASLLASLGEGCLLLALRSLRTLRRK